MNIQQAQQGVRLAWLFDGIAELPPRADCEISGITLDSRDVRPGDLFLACRGGQVHGARFIREAIAAGAAAVAWECEDGVEPESGLPASVPVIPVPALGRHAGQIAARFYGQPSQAMPVIGVTGTNGKTTITHLVARSLNAARRRCGLIGTLGYGFPERLEQGLHTTPDAVRMQRLLADMRAQDAQAVVMEVSSHALEQGRTGGIRYKVAAFTNLTRDHLDYHPDLAAYGRAKLRLFESPGLECAVVNTDDAFGREILRGLPPGVQATAVGRVPSGSDAHPAPAECASRHVELTHLELHSAGIRMSCNTHAGRFKIDSGLIGAFNASNLALSAGILLALGMQPDEVAERLSGAGTVPGRMEAIGGKAGVPLVIVDYAHTPDALEKVLRAARAHCAGTLWCVFGCGGERDRGKRPLMGAAATAWADRAVITDDNPRGEDPARIVAEIRAGIPEAAQYAVEHDRARAISMVLGQAGPEDVIVLAGKGHEDYQLVGAEIRPFSDRDTVVELLEGRWP